MAKTTLNALVVAVFCLQLAYFGYSQDIKTADSLKKELPQTTDTTRIKTLSKLFWNTFQYDPKQAKKYVDEELELAEKLGLDPFIGGSYNDLGVSYWTLSELDSAINSFEKALQVFKKIENKKKVSATLNNLGNLYHDKGLYDKSLSYHLHSLQIKEELQDTVAVANSYLNIANIHVEMGYLDRALTYYNDCLDIVADIPDSAMISSCYSNMASVYFDQQELKKSKEYHLKSIQIDKSLGNDYGVALNLDGLGQTYFKMKNYDSALLCYHESLTINSRLENKAAIALSHRNIGESLKEKQQYDQALQHLSKGLKMIHELNSLKDIMLTYRILSDTYEAKKDYATALEFYKTSRLYQDSVFSEEIELKINDLEFKYQTEKKEKEIAQQGLEIETLKQAALLQDFRKKGLTAALIAAVLLSGLIVYGQKQRMRRLRLESEKRQMEMENELTLRKKELTSHTLHLVQKNELLDNISLKLQELKKAPEVGHKELSRLIQRIKNDKIADTDWDNFKMYFDQVHEDFDRKLKEYFNDLTTNEIRLAALMKMKLSTKEIASILNISPDSVIKARYRLRKKLNMNSDDRLEDFILAL